MKTQVARSARSRMAAAPRRTAPKVRTTKGMPNVTAPSFTPRMGRKNGHATKKAKRPVTSALFDGGTYWCPSPSDLKRANSFGVEARRADPHCSQRGESMVRVRPFRDHPQ